MIRLTESGRKSLKDAFWAWLEPSTNAYSVAIDQLLDALPDDDLVHFVRARVGVDEPEG